MRKKKKSRGFQHILICVLLVGISVLCLWVGIQKIWDTYEINQSIIESQKKSDELSDELEELKQEKENLKNPEYLEYYARSKYQLSKEGEQVFKFSDEE